MGRPSIPDGDLRQARESHARPRTRSRRAVRVLIAVVAAALAAFGGGAVLAHRLSGESSGARTANRISVGPLIGTVRGTDLRGRPVALSRFMGKPLVVDFFGSWCGPCRREAGVFPAMARQFGGRISLLSVAVSDTAADAGAFAGRYGWTWPIVEDAGYRWAVAFALPGVPTTYVLDARGRVADRIVGPVTMAALSRDLRLLIAPR